MFNKDYILLKQLLQIIERINEYTATYENAKQFATDYKTFDATLMNFIALGETVGKINKEFRSLHKDIKWRKIYAFRNIIAHEYFGVDEEEILEIIKKYLPIFQKDLVKILNE
jgi:uncharacterized protein with HEPN domain